MRYYKPCKPGHNPYIDLTLYRELVAAFDDKQVIDSDAFKTAVVMLYGAVNKLFNANALAWHTNTPHRITTVAVRGLKRSGIWIQKGKRCKHEFNGKWANSGKDKGLRLIITFWIDVLVAEGVVVKLRNGKYGKRDLAKESFSKRLKNKFRWKELEKRNLVSLYYTR